jgi:hypothetical protein
VNLTRNNVKNFIQNNSGKLKGTILIPTDSVSGSDAAIQNQTRFKNAIQSVETHVNYDKKELGGVVKKLGRLEEDANFWEHQDNGLVIFFDSENYEYFKSPMALPEAVFVLDKHITSPLIIAVESTFSFYLIDINLSRPRLFYGSAGKLRQVEVDLMPGSFEDEVGRDEYLRQLQHQTGGVSGFHGHSEEEAINEDVRRYLKKVAEATERYLQDKDEPLLLAGTESRAGNLRKYLNYPHLIKDSLHGSYEKHSESQLADEVYGRIKKYFDNQVSDRVKEVMSAPPELVVVGSKEIAEAAEVGRVKSLFVSIYTNTGGANLDPKSLLELPGDINDLDEVVVSVFNQGGQIVALEKESYPEIHDARAICRY